MERWFQDRAFGEYAFQPLSHTFFRFDCQSQSEAKSKLLKYKYDGNEFTLQQQKYFKTENKCPMRTGVNYISIWMMILCFFFLSCETDIDREYVRPGWEVSAPVLSSEGFTNVAIDESYNDMIYLVINRKP